MLYRTIVSGAITMIGGESQVQSDYRYKLGNVYTGIISTGTYLANYIIYIFTTEAFKAGNSS